MTKLIAGFSVVLLSVPSGQAQVHFETLAICDAAHNHPPILAQTQNTI
jgi:hypothetical protein